MDLQSQYAHDAMAPVRTPRVGERSQWWVVHTLRQDEQLLAISLICLSIFSHQKCWSSPWLQITQGRFWSPFLPAQLKQVLLLPLWIRKCPQCLTLALWQEATVWINLLHFNESLTCDIWCQQQRPPLQLGCSNIWYSRIWSKLVVRGWWSVKSVNFLPYKYWWNDPEHDAQSFSF